VSASSLVASSTRACCAWAEPPWWIGASTFVRAADHLQRLAQVVAGHRPQPRTEAAVGVSGAVHSIDANPQLGIAVQPPRRPTDHGRPFIKTRVR
jgi:hypothetical protein